jgi:aminopeptidase N
MTKRFFIAIFLIAFSFSQAQQIHSDRQLESNKQYRASRTMVNDLIHTKLKVSFDFAKREMAGEEWVTLKPHFYPTNTLTLDAKAMQINEVKVNAKKAIYTYEDDKLIISLPKSFTKEETYEVYINYVAQPEKVKQEGSAAITGAKGLYFINPDGTEKDKPTEFWTQGETESSSCWFPTIDSPNQKTTSEIYMTVPNSFTTLSNGLLIDSKKAKKGNRTDHWKMNQKQAPYLMFMGAGPFEVIKDSWNGIPVNYYVEKEYAPYAQQIFGNTPEMIQFFSDFTGVPYAWDKYSQMVGRDYVSGAMENTTAVLHGESAYQDAGMLADTNSWENVIAHELFHHWFGDLVTTESWSNLTVNESFANYSEYLWNEYKYGQDQADAHIFDDTEMYFMSRSEDKDLVRFNYNSREDMFDAVSYNKGGAILHMLRTYMGDDAFKAAMKEYLTANKFGTGEAHQWRLAVEKVTGKDWNWFFNQWYFGSGHIKMDITYDYDESAKKVTVNLKQTQDKDFQFPLMIDIYENKKPVRHKVWVDGKDKLFTFNYTTKPKLVNVGAKQVLLAEINDDKTIENYAFQYRNAPLYVDRLKALDYMAEHKTNKIAKDIFIEALSDKYYDIRQYAMVNVDIEKSSKVRKLIAIMAGEDKDNRVKADALNLLLELPNIADYKVMFENAMTSESYSVAGAGIRAMYKLDPSKTATEVLTKYPLGTRVRGALKTALFDVWIGEKQEQFMPVVAEYAGLYPVMRGDDKEAAKRGFDWIANADNTEATQVVVDEMLKIGKKYAQYGISRMLSPVLDGLLASKEKLQSKNNTASLQQQVAIVKTAITKMNSFKTK